MGRKKICIYSEALYVIALFTLSFSIALMAAADLGVSVIVAPAYILSHKLTFLTFGQCEYLVQALVFVVFCVLMGRVRLVYFDSFLTCLIYGAVLDGWRAAVPLLNPAVTPPGSMELPLRVLYFLVGMVGTSFSVNLFFQTYFYPQVPDFFVKGINRRFGIDRIVFKRCFDASLLVISTVMTLLLLGRIVAIGPGTLVLTFCNGILIGWFGKQMHRCFDIVPRWPKLAKHFEL